MADIKITELNELEKASLNDNDVLPIVDISEDETKKIKVSSIKTDSLNEYSTSQTQPYSADYINNTNAYSTTETKTNKIWTNGKPVYRAVLNGNRNWEQTNYVEIPNKEVLDEIVFYTANWNNTIAGIGKPIPQWEESNIYSITYPNTSEGRIYVGGTKSGYVAGAFKVIVEYTKTTDSAS